MARGQAQTAECRSGHQAHRPRGRGVGRRVRHVCGQLSRGHAMQGDWGGGSRSPGGSTEWRATPSRRGSEGYAGGTGPSGLEVPSPSEAVPPPPPSSQLGLRVPAPLFLPSLPLRVSSSFSPPRLPLPTLSFPLLCNSASTGDALRGCSQHTSRNSPGPSTSPRVFSLRGLPSSHPCVSLSWSPLMHSALCAPRLPAPRRSVRPLPPEPRRSGVPSPRRGCLPGSGSAFGQAGEGEGRGVPVPYSSTGTWRRVPSALPLHRTGEPRGHRRRDCPH